MDVLVTGGTGVLGSRVVDRLRVGGHRARVLSRRPGSGPDHVVGDLATGAGLAEAVQGAEVVVHAGSATGSARNGRATDVVGTRRLLEWAREAGVRHFAFISIVGIERVTAFAYYRNKLAAEDHVREGGVPWSILRATQFHTLLDGMIGGFSRLPGLTLLPTRWRFQPLDPDVAADRLVEAALAEPAGMLPDLGGPEVMEMGSLARSWLGARGQRRRVVRLPMPGTAGRRITEGALTCPDRRGGGVTWEDYLARKYGGAR